MRGREDVSSFVADFAGDDRFIIDYLAEEVLDRLPPADRSFLLQTSNLDRLTGSLCDAVTGQATSKATLARLERANMFLVPLDDRRDWYRYHHLFGDVLKAHLLDEQPDAVAELHGRASSWYASQGDVAEGIRHALAARDFPHAADLVECALPALRPRRQEATIRTWLQALPDEVVAVRPVLIVGLVGALAAIGEFHADTDAQLDEAERLLDLVGSGAAEAVGEVIVGDETQLGFLPASIEMYRSALALTRGDLDGAEVHGRRVLLIAPDDDHLQRAGAAALVGLASWARGDLDAAFDRYSECVAGLLRAGHVADVLGCSITLVDLRLAQGRLRDASRIYVEGLELGTSQGAPLRGTADMHVGLSEICERAEYDAAIGFLDDAERVYMTDFSPSVRPIPAVRAGVLATHGNLSGAMAWVRERGLSADDELDYIGEFEYITLARVLLAQFRHERSGPALHEAVRLLERLLLAADAGGRTGASMQILVLLALAYDARGDRPTALGHLERAVTLAEPEGYVRLFLDQGPGIRTLLELLARQGPSAAYARRLLEGPPDDAEHLPRAQPLVDPLSDRELDVLRLLASDLSGPEIARELTVSLNTIRTHTKSIYTKLGVTSRRAAVRQGDEFQLLSRRSRR